jgi:glycosyltransferase involved in cell wall biosynthesis
MRVTAAIPAYNAGKYLGAAIESVLSQTLPCFECVVIDDGSADDTERVARSFPSVRYIRQDNGGDANARNRAITEARGDLIAFLDSDDVWLPTKIERQVERFYRDPELAMVYTGVQVVDASLEHLHDLRPASADEALKNTLCLQKPYMTGVGSSGMVSLAIARKIGFDERLHAASDWAFACNVAMRHRVDCIPEALVLYRQHSAGQVHRNLRAVEDDTRLALPELFADARLDPRLRRYARRAHAHLYLSLSSSYFTAEDRRQFLRCLAQAVIRRPDRVATAFWHRYFGPPP